MDQFGRNARRGPGGGEGRRRKGIIESRKAVVRRIRGNIKNEHLNRGKSKKRRDHKRIRTKNTEKPDTETPTLR